MNQYLLLLLLIALTFALFFGAITLALFIMRLLHGIIFWLLGEE